MTRRIKGIVVVALLMFTVLVLCNACSSDRGQGDVPYVSNGAMDSGATSGSVQQEEGDPTQETIPLGTGDAVQDTTPQETGSIVGKDAEPEGGNVSVATRYGSLLFPKKNYEKMAHREVVDGSVVTEIFSMVYDNTERELFRIYYGDAQAGNNIGFLKTESGAIPVSVYVSEYSDEAFAVEEARQLYIEMMEGLDTVLSSIWNDSRFAEPQEVEIVEVESQLKYWNLQLPENMEWEERTENGSYQVTFYGNVNGEKVKLYSALIGEPALESILGTYQFNGKDETVSVESYDLPDVSGWPENASAELYMMMGTINEMIQAIMSSGNFTEQMPENSNS